MKEIFVSLVMRDIFCVSSFVTYENLSSFCIEFLFFQHSVCTEKGVKRKPAGPAEKALLCSSGCITARSFGTGREQ